MPRRSPRTERPRLVPLGGTRAEALQRLQVGGSLLLGIIVIVGLANVIEERAKQAEDSVVPQAAATMGAGTSEPAGNDPLADAGVVPDLPAATGGAAAQKTPRGVPARRDGGP